MIELDNVISEIERQNKVAERTKSCLSIDAVCLLLSANMVELKKDGSIKSKDTFNKSADLLARLKGWTKGPDEHQHNVEELLRGIHGSVGNRGPTDRTQEDSGA